MSATQTRLDELTAKRSQARERYDELMAKNDELLEASGGEAINKDKRDEFKAQQDEALQLRKQLEHYDLQIEDAGPKRERPEVMEALNAELDESDTAFRRWAQSEGKGDLGMDAAERKQFVDSAGRFRVDRMVTIELRRRAVRNRVYKDMGLLSEKQFAAENAQLIQAAERYGALVTPSTGAGVPVSTVPGIVVALQSIEGVRPKATVFRTAGSEPMPFTLYDDRDREGEFVAEGTSTNTGEDDGETITNTTLNGFQLSSKRFPVNRKLIENAAFDVEAFVRSQNDRSIALRENKWFSTGTGTNQPTGYRTLAADGPTTASAVAFTMKELLDLIYSLDPVHRRMGATEGMGGVSNSVIGGAGGCFIMHDSVLGYIRGLEDGENRQLWEKNYQMGTPDRLFGYPIQIDQHATALGTTRAPAANQKLVAFGDLSYYAIRDAGPGHMDMLVDTDHVGKNEIGFLRWVYTDGDVIYPRVSSKVDCIKLLVQKA